MFNVTSTQSIPTQSICITAPPVPLQAIDESQLPTFSTDAEAEASLSSYIGNRYVVVLSGIQDDAYADENAASNALSHALARLTHGADRELLIICEGVKDGAAWMCVASQNFAQTVLGLMSQSRAHLDRLTQLCDGFMVMPSTSQSPTMPQSGKRVVIRALEMARERKGGEMIGIGDGDRVFDDLIDAARSGFRTTFFRGHGGVSGLPPDTQDPEQAIEVIRQLGGLIID